MKDPIAEAVQQALDTVHAYCDAVVVLASVSDDNGNSYGICESRGSMHTIVGLCDEFGWDYAEPSAPEAVGRDDDED